MKTIHRFYHAALAGALFCLVLKPAIAVGPSRIDTRDDVAQIHAAADGAAARWVANTLNASEKPEPTEALSAAAVGFSGELDLVTTSLFTGSIPVGKRGLNLIATSSLPAAKGEGGDQNNYNDAQLMLPTGGVVNIMFSPFAAVGSVNWNQANSDRALPYGRADLSDRTYLMWKRTDTTNPARITGIKKVMFTDSQAPDFLGTHAPRFYTVHGLGPKLINRDKTGSSSSSAEGYGLGAGAYLGLGVDGGLFQPKDPNPAGNYRIESFISGSWVDSSTIKKLYPDATEPNTTGVAWAGSLSITLGKKFQTNVQWAVPLGSGRKHMARVLLVGLTVAK